MNETYKRAICIYILLIDYFVIDVTKLIKNPTLKTVSAVDSSDLSFIAIVKYGKVKPDRYSKQSPNECTKDSRREHINTR